MGAGDELWKTPGRGRYFRYLAEDVVRRPDSPWHGEGRFDNGIRYTLYLAETPEGAAAEYYRRHPEFLGLQDYVKIRVYQLDMELPEPHLDVRTRPLAVRAEIDFERLVSNDADPNLRFKECRELADDVELTAGFGLAYPSAARQHESNLVTFGEASAHWSTYGIDEVARPVVDPASVQVLPPEARS